MNPWGYTHWSPRAKLTMQKSSLASSRSNTASVIKALRLPVQTTVGHLLCHRTLSGNKNTADDHTV